MPDSSRASAAAVRSASSALAPQP
uniref:Uncharacterized protein n=1 Tax=Arundo donax TaxID=35708 RepID=A0A0A9CRV7_ARUDO